MHRNSIQPQQSVISLSSGLTTIKIHSNSTKAWKEWGQEIQPQDFKTSGFKHNLLLHTSFDKLPFLQCFWKTNSLSWKHAEPAGSTNSQREADGPQKSIKNFNALSATVRELEEGNASKLPCC